MDKRSLITGVAALAIGLAVNGAAMADPIEIKFFDRYTSSGQTDFSKWLVDSFNESHAGKIHVTSGGIQDDGFKPKINAVLRSPDAPDVFYSWEGGWAKYMIDSGYAAPLNDYYQKYGWAKTMSPAGLKLATFDGTQYFVPTMMSASLVWYRPEKIKAAGIAPTILANQQRWPAQFLWSGIFVNKYGVDVYDQLIGRKIPWTDPRVVDAFQQMKDFADKGYFEEGANGLDVSPAVIPFSQGKAATWYQGTFMIPRFIDEKGQPKFPLDVFPMPKIGDKEPTISVFAENTLMLNANSQNKDAAAEFLDYAISQKAQTEQALGQAKLLYPSNTSVDISSLPPLTKKIGDLIAGYQQSTFMHVDHAVSPAVSDPYLEVLQSVIIGKMSPAQAAAETEKAAEGDQGPVKP